MTTRSLLIISAALLSAAACASSPAGSPAATQQSSQSSSHHSNDVLTEEDFAKTDAQTALDAVRRLRPNFLQPHGGESTSLTLGRQDVVVYVDNTRMGGPSFLAQIPINEVKEIQYLNGTDATQRFGTGHGSGAIIVTRK